MLREQSKAVYLIPIPNDSVLPNLSTLEPPRVRAGATARKPKWVQAARVVEVIPFRTALPLSCPRALLPTTHTL